MRKKRFLTVVLSASMVMSSTVVAFGASTVGTAPVSEVTTVSTADGSTSGNGTIEGYVDKNVFSVELPTTPVASSTFDFYLDPQGLIEATSGNKYVAGNSNNRGATSVNGYGTLYFVNTLSSNKAALSTSSDSITITNKGAVDVDVAVTADITDNDGIVISDNQNNMGTEKASMYLELFSVSPNAVSDTISANGGGELTASVSGSAAAYKVSYNSTTNLYEYAVPSDDDVDYADYSFQLRGACNDSSAWKDLFTANAQPSVEITWDVKPEGYVEPEPAAPSIETLNYTLNATNANQDTNIQVDLGVGDLAATGITSITNTTSSTALTSSQYEFDATTGILTIKGSVTQPIFTNNQNNATRSFRIVFNDANATSETIIFTISK